VRFSNPFAQPGHWFKGNLHVHSTLSDGERTPEEVMAWYRDRGYHFLALTDHGVLSEALNLADDFITIKGIEVDGTDPQAGLYHLVGLGPSALPSPRPSEGLSMQQAAGRLLSAGGLAFLAHPYWSGQMSKDLLSLEGCLGLEIYNGGCEVDNARGLATVHWDDLLAAGRRLWGLAVDDAHWRQGCNDAGLGWIWVKAATLSQEAILYSLVQGHFYSSSGPRIHDLRLEDGMLRVRCSPATVIDFVGHSRHSCRVAAPPGETLTEAAIRPYDLQRYVRVACRDDRGCWAWSNPIFLEEG
jgi:hypothetical protein